MCHKFWDNLIIPMRNTDAAWFWICWGRLSNESVIGVTALYLLLSAFTSVPCVGSTPLIRVHYHGTRLGVWFRTARRITLQSTNRFLWWWSTRGWHCIVACTSTRDHGQDFDPCLTPWPRQISSINYAHQSPGEPLTVAPNSYLDQLQTSTLEYSHLCSAPPPLDDSLVASNSATMSKRL